MTSRQRRRRASASQRHLSRYATRRAAHVRQGVPGFPPRMRG
jgi:hypothetical protein